MLLHPWDFLGKSTGVGCHFLLQEIFLTQGSNPGLLHCRQMLYRLINQGSWQQSLLWFQQSGVKARPHHPRRRCHHYQSVTSNTHKPSMSSLSPWVLPHLSLAPAGGEEGQEFSSLLTYSLRVIDTRAHFFPSVPTPSHLPLVLERGPLSGVSGWVWSP